MAQTAPTNTSQRQIDFGALALVAHDSNIAHSNKTQAALRGVTPEDTTFRPSARFNIVQPIGRQAIYLNGTAGYDFHQNNKQLDHENIGAIGGLVLSAGPCQPTASVAYASAQSDPEDVPGPQVSNLLETVTGNAEVACGAQTGFNGHVGVVHVDTSNSAVLRKVSNHTVNGITAGVGYSNVSLGAISALISRSEVEFPNRVASILRTGDGYTATSYSLSYQKTFGPKLLVDASLGETEIERDFALPGVPLSTRGTNYSITATYKLGSRLELTGTSARAFLPSNQAGKLYNLVTHTEISGNYKLGSRFVITLGGIVEDSKANVDSAFVARIPTDYQKNTLYGSLSYRQSDRATLVFDLRQEEKDTNVPEFNYSNTHVSLSLDVSF